MQFIYFKHCKIHSLRGRGKRRGGGGEGREKRAKGKKEGKTVSFLSLQSPFFFPFLPILYPFRRHIPSQVLSPILEEWIRFFPKQVHHIIVQDFHPAKRLNSISSETNSCQNQKHKQVSFMISQCVS